MKDIEWDKLLNIKTTGRDDTDSDTYRYPYEPTPYSVLERLANEGLVGKCNTLLDYGCGKGRVDIFVSYQTKCKSIGIEYIERICKRAADNKNSYRGGEKVEFICTDAIEYKVPKEVDRIFFFNPFSVELLHGVINNILSSYYENPREILLFFYYPSDEYIVALMQESMLEFYDEIDCRDLFDAGDERERVMIFRMD